MNKIAAIEEQIASLSQEELAELDRWFEEFKADAWDRQIEQNAAAGLFDELAARAQRDYAEGKITELPS